MTLPTWTHVAADPLDFSECGDGEQESFDLWTQEHFTLSIARLDVWITERIEAGKQCGASLRHRAAVFAAYKADNPTAAEPHMECLWRAWQMSRAVPALRRDKGRQEGTRKPREPAQGLQAWIDRQVKRGTGETARQLWERAPESFTDAIGFERFRKRVTAARKTAGMGRE